MTMPRLARTLDKRLIVLPLIALATALAVLIPAELTLRALYPAQEIDRCINETLSPPHGTPGCTSRVKAAEGPWTENRYNGCGYRSPASCGPVPAGTARIAVIGSSMGAGFFVPEPDSIAGRLPADLAAACRRPVETQNLALPDYPLTRIADSAREALRLKPDVILFTVTSYDVAKPADSGASKTAKPFIKQLTDTAQQTLKDFSIVYMAKKMYLSSEKDYMSFIAAQKRSYEDVASETAGGVVTLDDQLDRISDANSGHAVPIVLAFLPDREEIARVRLWPEHRDPLAVALARVAHARHIPFINGLDAIPGTTPTADLYYVANGHMNGTGDGMIARGLAKGLAASVPAFSECRFGAR